MRGFGRRLRQKMFPLHRPTPVGGIVPNIGAERLVSRIRSNWRARGLNDDDDSGGFLDNLGGFLQQAAGAYGTYTTTQTQAMQAQAAARQQQALLEAQRRAASAGSIIPTGGSKLGGAIFGIPVSALVLVGGGLLAYKLLSKR